MRRFSVACMLCIMKATIASFVFYLIVILNTVILKTFVVE